MKNNIKKIVLVVLFCFVISFFTLPAFSKYRSNTSSRIINLFTRYNINYVTAGGRILNPEDFSSYVSVLGLTLPTEDDVDRIGYDFNGWYANNGFTGSPITSISSGETGEKTFYASWIVSRYTLTVNVSYGGNNIEGGLPDDWDLVIGKDGQGNDILATLDNNGQIVVDKGETVSFRTRISSGESFTSWTINEDILVTERYRDGDQYIYYDFRMPRHDVTATYGEENDGCIDLSKSSITFEEGVQVGNRTQDGFWYNSTIRGMSPMKTDVNKGNFYVWDNSETFCVTSKGNATQNQLTIVNGMTVNFVNCVMAVTDDYSDDVVNRKIDTMVMETKGNGTMNDTASSAWKDYGNIILSYSDHIIYTVNFNIEDENTLGAIFTDEYHKNEGYKLTVNIKGDSKTNDIAYIAGVWGNMDINFSSMTVEQYANNTSLNQDYPDNSEYLTWTTIGQSAKGNVKFTSCNINAEDKRIYSGYGYIYFVAATASVGSLRAAYMLYTQAVGGVPSNVHVLEDVYVYYYGLSQSGNSTFIVDGDFRINGYSSSGTSISNGLIVVKGNLFDTGSLTMSGGTIIANILVVGASSNISGNSKIITNAIINNPNGRPVFSSSTGYQTATFGGTTSLTLANKNNDNIPFRTYGNSSTSSTNYTFSGGNIYLYGYYELDNGILSNTFTTKSVGNPLKTIVEEYESNGLTNLSDSYLITNMSSTNNETFVLGDSSRNDRTYRFSGATVKSAGNITLYNNAVISNGTVSSLGTISCKNNLTITGGTVIANEIGNIYNLYTTTNSLNSWKFTNITGGSITTNKIGAVTRKINNIDPKSYVSIGTDATFTVKDNNKIDIVSDVYVNYVYSNLFSNDVSNPNSIRFSGDITGGTNKTLNNLVITDPTPVNNKVTIVKPTLIADGQQQKWKHGSLTGTSVDYVDEDGYLNGDTTSNKIYLNSEFNLYAAKGSYNLTVHGSNYSATSDGNTITFNNDSAIVNSDSVVVLTLQNIQMAPKTVVWYYDDSGLLHNAITDPNAIDTVNGTITFNMPYADTDIYITDELELDLYKYEVVFTSDGFAVEFDSGRRSDSNFTYSGNLKVIQSNIARIVNRMTHGTNSTSYFNNPFNAYTSTNATASNTTNRIKFESGADILNRTITFSKIKQSLSTTYGVFIEDGENITINIRNEVQLAAIQVTANTNLTICGNDNDVDALNIIGYDIQIGNSSGKTGNITLEDLWLIEYQGKLVYAKTKNTKQITLNNVKMDTYVYYRISFATNISDFVANNCDIYAIVGGDTANALFSGVTNATFNNTYFSYLSGGGRNHTNLFLGTTNMYIKGTSNVLYNFRNSSATSSSFETFTYSSLASLVEVSNTAVVSIDHRIRLKKLVVKDNAQFKIDKLGSSQADIDKATYLLADSIEVNGGLVQADNIIISGFHTGNQTNESGVITALNNNSSILNGTSYIGLVVNGGTVRAYNFVGGDVNGKINVTGGTLEALGIGTIGKLYGFATYLPKVGEEYVYSIDKLPNAGTVINITGGTVNVLANGYLGGMRTTVNISGGTVNLGSGAILGINETDRTKLYNDATSHGNTPSNFVNITISGGEVTGNNGKISTPYSTLAISGASTGINTSEIVAEAGTINIQAANSKYTCPIDSSKDVGIIATTKITGLNVNITNGASVYGGRITSSTLNTTDSGILTVDSTSSIYSNSYGSEGSGTSTVTINGTAVGSRQYNILYVMNDNYQDRATNSNPEYYISGSGLQLSNPTRFGFTFSGWYLNNNLITEVSSSQTGDIEIEARWIPNQVAFKVTIKASDVGLSASEFANEVSGLDGVLDGNKFTFNGTVLIDYRDLLIGTNNIDYSNYNLPNHLILSAKINNNTLNPDNDEINVASSTVTQEIMEYYLNNNEPIEIAIVSIS